jgi:hypothetical protein
VLYFILNVIYLYRILFEFEYRAASVDVGAQLVNTPTIQAADLPDKVDTLVPVRLRTFLTPIISTLYASPFDDSDSSQIPSSSPERATMIAAFIGPAVSGRGPSAEDDVISEAKIEGGWIGGNRDDIFAAAHGAQRRGANALSDRQKVGIEAV